MLTVTLFTKAGCGLCDEVKISLEWLQADYPHELQEVDINQNDSLLQQYRYKIPVVRIGTEELSAPISAQQLKQALQAVIH